MDAPNPDDLSLKLKVLKQIPLFQHIIRTIGRGLERR